MAYRRCVTARAKLLYQHHRFSPSFSYINHHDDNKTNAQSPKSSFSTPTNVFALNGSNTQFILQRFSSNFHSTGSFGSGFGRNMSTSIGEGVSEKAEMLTDVDVFVDSGLESVTAQVAPALDEVAVAAADSFLPIASLQYFMESVHVITGFNWWASIALTTIFIRLLTTPLMINQMKATSKFTLLRPKLEAVKQEMQEQGMSPDAVAEGQTKMKELFKEYKVTPFTPLKGLLIQGPVFVCFFLAIQNMAAKVPSFQQGGAYWFLDLTTPDPMYILPCLTAFTFWMTVEYNMQDGMEGNPAAKTIKNVSRVFAALTVPLTASFPKAIFFYWITANLFALMYGVVIKKPTVKELLGIPIIPVTPPSPSDQQEPVFSFTDAIKKYAAAHAEQQRKTIEQEVRQKYAAAQAEQQKNTIVQEVRQQSLASAAPTEASPAEASPAEASPAEASEGMKQKIPSSAILSQRIRSLEKEVKERKKAMKKN